MRIALLTPGITPYVMGGLQRHSFNLVKHLAHLGIKIDLYHTDFADSKDIHSLEGIHKSEKDNITSIAVPWIQKGFIPGHYLRELKCFSARAYDFYQDRPATNFIISKSLTAWEFVEAKRQQKELPPIGVNLHGFEMFQPPANIKSGLDNYLLRPDFYNHAHHANYLFSYGGKITSLIKDKLKVPSDKILEIPGGIDADWLLKEVEESFTPKRFIFLGRFERRKGIQELHKAIQSNPGWQGKAHFHFIGPIPKEKRLHLPYVSYSGAIQNSKHLREKLRQADVILCPSHSEGMPNVIMEGMASGLAVLATDVGAVCLLVDAHNGVLLPKVSIQGITKGINHFLDMDSATLKQMKQASLERIQSFTWDSIAKQTISKIQEVLSGR